jgi:mono/diheme cytochrome c family protein
MTVMKLALAAVPAVWLLAVTAVPEAAQSKSVNDGVFTDAQVARGEAAYKKDCNSCHGQGLEGDGFAPALSGAEFMGNWNGTTVGDLYDRIRISMPPGNPASVPAQAKADIVAFMLKANKYPAGSSELTPETLKDIKIDLPK